MGGTVEPGGKGGAEGCGRAPKCDVRMAKMRKIWIPGNAENALSEKWT